LIKLYNGDALEILSTLPENIADMIFADLPYGKTANKWDIIIPFDILWSLLLRLGKNHTPYIFTANSGFEYMLYASNPTMYKYKWIWNKNNSAGFANAKYRPFQITEDILVFGTSQCAYYPIMEVRDKVRTKGGGSASDNYNGLVPSKTANNFYFPKNILNISNACQVGKVHPTQKPIPLLEYLISTYTNPGDIVLDPVMGSGTTGIAAINTGRHFIGIEKDAGYFEIAKQRIEKARKDKGNNE